MATMAGMWSFPRLMTIIESKKESHNMAIASEDLLAAVTTELEFTE